MPYFDERGEQDEQGAGVYVFSAGNEEGALIFLQFVCLGHSHMETPPLSSPSPSLRCSSPRPSSFTLARAWLCGASSFATSNLAIR